VEFGASGTGTVDEDAEVCADGFVAEDVGEGFDGGLGGGRRRGLAPSVERKEKKGKREMGKRREEGDEKRTFEVW
jgi:hypothetical protein